MKADLNTVISNVLRCGVILSSTLVVLGTLLLLAESPPGLPTNVQQLVSTNFGRPTLSVGTLFGNLSVGNPVFVIQLGLLVLLATPIVRVAASSVTFAAERDRLYVVITLTVLAILMFSLFVVGPLVAGST